MYRSADEVVHLRGSTFTPSAQPLRKSSPPQRAMSRTWRSKREAGHGQELSPAARSGSSPRHQQEYAEPVDLRARYLLPLSTHLAAMQQLTAHDTWLPSTRRRPLCHHRSISPPSSVIYGNDAVPLLFRPQALRQCEKNLPTTGDDAPLKRSEETIITWRSSGASTAGHSSIMAPTRTPPRRREWLMQSYREGLRTRAAWQVEPLLFDRLQDEIEAAVESTTAKADASQFDRLTASQSLVVSPISPVVPSQRRGPEWGTLVADAANQTQTVVRAISGPRALISRFVAMMAAACEATLCRRYFGMWRRTEIVERPGMEPMRCESPSTPMWHHSTTSMSPPLGLPLPLFEELETECPAPHPPETFSFQRDSAARARDEGGFPMMTTAVETESPDELSVVAPTAATDASGRSSRQFFTPEEAPPSPVPSLDQPGRDPFNSDPFNSDHDDPGRHCPSSRPPVVAPDAVSPSSMLEKSMGRDLSTRSPCRFPGNDAELSLLSDVSEEGPPLLRIKYFHGEL